MIGSMIGNNYGDLPIILSISTIPPNSGELG